MRRIREIQLSFLLVLGVTTALADERAPDSRGLPPFQQFYNLVLKHLPGVTEADLNRAAVSGLLSQLENRVLLLSNAPPTALRSYSLPLDKTAVFDRAFAYLRIKNFQTGLAPSFARAYDEMRSTNKLNGLVVDLRFADGSDYAEAAAVGDLFFPREHPLLKWGDSSRRSTVKTNSISLPVTLLVNHRTAGAAEALAALLREAEIGLIVGSPTAGHAQVFREYSLGDGHKVRIASGTIEVGDGHALSPNGIKPDIQVQVSEELEQGYLEDPYRVSTPGLGRIAAGISPAGSARTAAGALSPRRKLTESILIRESQERDDPDLGEAAPTDESSPPALVQDPALARALDVLKGLALVRTRR